MKKKVQVIQNKEIIYFITNEDIKKGDYIYSSSAIPNAQISPSDIKNPLFNAKIIATSYRNEHTPLIPQSFIEEYKSKSIKEVEIEMNGDENCYACNYITSDFEHTCNKPKLSPQGEVIISPIEERLYTKEEMKMAWDNGYKKAVIYSSSKFDEFIKTLK